MIDSKSYENVVLKTEESSTGGTIEHYSWGIRHRSGIYGGEASKFNVKNDNYNPTQSVVLNVQTGE
jgi:hypothetical protein